MNAKVVNNLSVNGGGDRDVKQVSHRGNIVFFSDFNLKSWGNSYQNLTTSL